MRHSAKPSLLPFAAALLVLAAAGCDRDNVKVYKVDSTNAVVTLPPPASPGGMPRSEERL